ncbi:MAG: thiamine phosphate synthase [Planctomycetota bacterium]|nr:MAG: thiamine phosphate synthase [Planctomycetota bacterium]
MERELFSLAERLGALPLYVILGYREESAFRSLLLSLLRAGVRLFQLRFKGQSEEVVLAYGEVVRSYTADFEAFFILNDRLDLALRLGADGVHLGAEDGDIVLARRRLGERRILGVSARTVSDALRAEEQGADYLGVGAVFASLTKPEAPVIGVEVVCRVQEVVSIPVFAIGGIREGNLSQLSCYGVRRVAVSDEAFLGRDVQEIVEKFFSKLLI